MTNQPKPAPTAEEQPWNYLKESARTSDHMHVHGATIFNLIEQLEAALRSNREKDAQLAEREAEYKELLQGYRMACENTAHEMDLKEAAEAKLRAVSEAAKEPDPTFMSEWIAQAKEAFAHIRAIVEAA